MRGLISGVVAARDWEWRRAARARAPKPAPEWRRKSRREGGIAAGMGGL